MLDFFAEVYSALSKGRKISVTSLALPCILGLRVASEDLAGWANGQHLLQTALKFIAVVPDSKLPTVLARQAIPQNISHHDAVFNASRSALLVGALMSGRYEYIGEALEDKLHQPYRAHLIPGLYDAFAAAKEAGAYNAIISGAGSTVMAYADPDADCEGIAKAMQAVFFSKKENCKYFILDLDKDGVKSV